MKESIQRSGNEVSIVIYDAPLPPRYFRFSKRFIRFLFTTLPVFIGVMITTFFLWGLGSRIQQAPRPALPQMTNDKDAKIATLESELKILQESNQQFVEKIGGLNTVSTDEEIFLPGLRKPYGMQNLISQNIISLGQFELQHELGKTTLKFQIINPNPEKRVSGHIIVYMLSEAGMLAYPAKINEALTSGAKYSAGETFAVSRLRPTNAEFLLKPSGSSVKFMIFIFNREGDLLIMQETEPFKMGPKT
jgi:hypothetical protein